MKQYIVHVVAIGAACQILTNSLALARAKRTEVETHGVWEARNGVRWLMIDPINITKISITSADSADRITIAPRASQRRSKKP